MRKLGGIISDELLISKEKVELSASICKTRFNISGLVGEFPELQGLMGGYFSAYQGFDKDISLALAEQYLPIGLNSKTLKPFSIALSITDKIDVLVGFFGINEKPTSSKDPFALRRLALGIIRTVIENKKNFKINDLLNFSSSLYQRSGSF